jgi:hypothetical protein
LKLKCDVLLSTSAFKFNLRRYTKEFMSKGVGFGRNATNWRGRARAGKVTPEFAT